MQLIDDLTAVGITKKQALSWINLHRTTVYKRKDPNFRTVEDPMPHDQRPSRVKLSDDERATIAAQLNAAPEKTVAQVFHDALDAGVCVASERSYYRVAASYLCLSRAAYAVKAKTRNTPTTTAPVLVADNPNETLVWDITCVTLQEKGKVGYLHTIMDLFSRKILGYQVASRPSDEVAVTLFEEIIAEAKAQGMPVKTVHADNGASMKSHKISTLFAAHEIVESHSRPHVSDDNPHIESHFSTMKRNRSYPRVFDTIDDAQAWVEKWVDNYNNHRIHGGLRNFTPQQVYSGQWKQVWQQRQHNYEQLFLAHPERFGNTKPTIAPLIPGVRFNCANDPDGTVKPQSISEQLSKN